MGNFLNFVNEAVSKPHELEIKNKIQEILKKEHIKLKPNSSHSYWHCRANVGPKPIEFFKDRGIKCQETNISLSGRYETYTIGFNKKETIFFVNQNVQGNSNKIFKTKELTPEKFHLSGKILKPNEIIRMVREGLETMNYPEDAKKQLIKLLKDVKNAKGKSIGIEKLNFSNPDLKIISADFGEILGSIWTTNNIGFTKIEFPNAVNEPLVDFYGRRFDIKFPVSVKSGGGSATSIKNLGNALQSAFDQIDKFSQKEQKLLKVIKLLRDSTIVEGVIEACKTLNTPGFRELQKVTGIKDPNGNNLINWIETMSTDKLKYDLQPFFKKCGREPKKDTWSKDIMKAPDRKLGFIMYPLTASLVDILNSKERKKELSKIAKSIIVLQINVDVKAKKIIFKRKQFKNATFKFSWQGGAPNFARNRVGFKME